MKGTGKTLLAKAVANQTSATFMRVVGSELIQKYLGEVKYHVSFHHHCIIIRGQNLFVNCFEWRMPMPRPLSLLMRSMQLEQSGK